MSSNETNKSFKGYTDKVFKYVFERVYYSVDYINHDDLLEDMIDNPSKYLLGASNIKKVEEVPVEEMMFAKEV